MKALVISCVLILAALSGPSVLGHGETLDYSTHDGIVDAIHAYPQETRYLALSTDSEDAVALGGPLPAHMDFHIGRDVRVIAPASDPAARQQQQRYVARYDSTMRVLLQANPVSRPPTISRSGLRTVCLLLVAPFLIMVYLRWRLDSYRGGGISWLTLTWSWMRPSLYPDDARPLLVALWLTIVATIPWAVWLIVTYATRPLYG